MFWKLSKAMKNNKKGFTLVELMVVVVIIGVLVAIAIPIYNTVQTSAQHKAFEANHRTLVGGIQVHMAENDGAKPAAATGIDPYIHGTLADLQGKPVAGATYVWNGTTLTSTLAGAPGSPLTYTP